MSAEPDREVVEVDGTDIVNDVSRAIRRATQLVMATVVIVGAVVVGVVLAPETWWSHLVAPVWLILWALFLLWQARK